MKDQFKTDKGKYISPAPIEVKILSNPDIESACVVGTGIPQPIALVTLSESGIKKDKTLLAAELENLCTGINKELEVFEKLEKMVVMKENWTVVNKFLTPTLKVKRNEIEKIHLPNYPMWFLKKEKIVWED